MPCLQVYIGEQNACNNQMWRLLDGTASRAFPLARDATTGAYRIGDEALTEVCALVVAAQEGQSCHELIPALP